MRTYDVVIIGAGSAGLTARSTLSKVTDNYLVVDDGPLGTTCARVGCMPSKALIEAANVFHARAKFAQVGASGEVRLDGTRFLAHVRELRDGFVASVRRNMEKWQDTHFRAARARFVGADRLQIGDDTVGARRVVVATGSEPVLPWRDLGLLTSDTVFEMTDLPRSLAVIGLGPLGLEMAQGFARAGVKVTAFGDTSRIGGLREPGLAAEARALFAREFDIVDGEVHAVEPGYRVRAAAGTFEAERVLVAIGRRPRVGDLGLAAAGAQFDEHGAPVFSKTTFRIAGTNAYLAGDANADRPLYHEAIEQGRFVGAQVTREVDAEYRAGVPLAITFSSPQIARVGRTDEGRRGEADMSDQGRALTRMENAGRLHVYGEKGTGRLLGGEFLAPGAEHLAHALAWAIARGVTVTELLEGPFYHPTLEEGLRSALQNLAKKLAPSSGGNA